MIKHIKLAVMRFLLGCLGAISTVLGWMIGRERPSDDARALLGRIESGELTRERVELAARLGHSASRLLCSTVELSDWAGGLSGLRPDATSDIEAALALTGDEVIHARLAADWAERVLPLFEGAHPQDERPRQAIAAARAWAADPSDQNREAASAAADAAGEIADAASDEANDATADASDAEGYASANALYAAAHAANAAADAAGCMASFSPGVTTSEIQAAAWSTRDVGSNARLAVGYTAEGAHLVIEGEGGTGHAADEAHDAEGGWQRLRLAGYVLGEVDHSALS